MRYVWRCFRYLRPYWRLALVSLVLLLLATVFSLLGPWPLKLLVDNVLEGQPLPPFLGDLLGGWGENRDSLLVIVVLAGLAIVLIDNALGVISKFVNTKIEQHMVLDVRSDLYRHTQKMSLAFHDRRKTGRVIHALNNQGAAVGALVMTVPDLGRNVLMLLGMFWIIYHIDAGLAVLSLIVLPLLYLSVKYYGKRVLPTVRQVRNLEMQSLSIVHEAISMIRVILAFGRENHEYRRFREHGERAVAKRVRVTVKETFFSLFVSMSTGLGTALVLGFGAYRALHGQITVGELLVVITYIAAIYKPLEAISFNISTLQHKLVNLEVVFGMLDKEPEIQDAPNAVTLERSRGEVEYRAVSFAYQGRKETLKDLSFRVQPGQLVGIVGPTGAGKSTLVSLLPRFYEPQSGDILLDGRNVRDLTLHSLRAQISIVLQEPMLFSGTIADNIRYGRLDAGMEDILRAAQDANAHDFIMQLPDQYETVLGERGAQLSGGERQRICVARAFLKDAPILILDEPTSAIDSRTEAVILDALERLLVGRTTFMIAHRLSTIRNADLILVVHQGEIVASGTHDQLLLQRGLYKQLHDLQTRQARGKPQPVIERVGGLTAEITA
jgi:ATP-binding cassette, subfamily B, bacterial